MLYPAKSEKTTHLNIHQNNISFGYNHRVHTEWQRPLSVVHSIMMKN
jgi:hypothetical protein